MSKVLTFIALSGGCVVPVFMDLGSSHLFNELWDAHARSHLVWMIASFFLIFILGGVVLSTSLMAGTGAVALEVTKEKDSEADLMETDKEQPEEPVPREIQLAGLSIAWRQLSGNVDEQSRLYRDAEIYNNLKQNKDES